jgi:MFS family permease
MNKNQNSVFNIAVIVAALGYFVDIYDLLLFTIIREPSLKGIGVIDPDMLTASTKIINWQMIGLLIGGVIWGVLGDKKGRLSVLFGSIILYSVANFATGFVQTVDQYAWARFIAGLGLAGELGAGITLVSELLPKEKRGIGTSLVAGLGLSGAIVAYFVYKLTNDWRLCYKIGGGLGLSLLLLRISVAESGMFKQVQHENVSKGNFLLFFSNKKRFKKYLLVILTGLPVWYVIGILINLSNRFATELYGDSSLESGRSIMFGYIGISIGGIVIGFLSQQLKSRKKALYCFYALTILSGALYFSPVNNDNATMYIMCGLLGFSVGFWSIFVTIGAEQFGTNLRATAATTIPNIVRGALPLMNLLFINLFQHRFGWSLTRSGMITGLIVMAITVAASLFIEETFTKDLNYLETKT